MNKKGVTMVSLVFYVLSFFIVVSIIGSITIFATKNIDVMNYETDNVYSQNQVDKFLRKFFSRKDEYMIVEDKINNAKYIVFSQLDSPNITNTIKYYPESTTQLKGCIFLEVKDSNNLQKKLFITDNVLGLEITEEETGLGKTVTFDLTLEKGDESEIKNLSYGVKR